MLSKIGAVFDGNKGRMFRRPLLKRITPSLISSTPVSSTACSSEALDGRPSDVKRRVHFSPSSSVTCVFVTHSADTYDRSPIKVNCDSSSSPSDAEDEDLLLAEYSRNGSVHPYKAQLFSSMNYVDDEERAMLGVDEFGVKLPIRPMGGDSFVSLGSSDEEDDDYRYRVRLVPTFSMPQASQSLTDLNNYSFLSLDDDAEVSQEELAAMLSAFPATPQFPVAGDPRVWSRKINAMTRPNILRSLSDPVKSTRKLGPRVSRLRRVRSGSSIRDIPESLISTAPPSHQPAGCVAIPESAEGIPDSLSGEFSLPTIGSLNDPSQPHPYSARALSVVAE